MVMRMLAAGGFPVVDDHRRAPDVDNPHGYFECERVKHLAADNQWLSECHGKAIKVVSPLLFHLPPIRNYRIILVSRPLDQVLTSQRRMLQNAGRPAPDDDAAIRTTFEYHLKEVAAWLLARPAYRVLSIEYAAVIATPAVIARRIVNFIGHSLDEALMAEAVDPSLFRNRSGGLWGEV